MTNLFFVGGARSQLSALVRSTKLEVDDNKMSPEARDSKIAALIVNLDKFRYHYYNTDCRSCVSRTVLMEIVLFDQRTLQQAHAQSRVCLV